MPLPFGINPITVRDPAAEDQLKCGAAYMEGWKKTGKLCVITLNQREENRHAVRGGKRHLTEG